MDYLSQYEFAVPVFTSPYRTYGVWGSSHQWKEDTSSKSCIDDNHNLMHLAQHHTNEWTVGTGLGVAFPLPVQLHAAPPSRESHQISYFPQTLQGQNLPNLM